MAILLQHAGKLLEDQVRAKLDVLGLHPAQGHVLRLLERADGVSQRQLTQKMRIAAPTVSGVLKRMEATGLIDRCVDPDDERVTRVRLTRQGRARARAAAAAIDQVEQQLIADLSTAQLRGAHSILRRLRNNLGGRPPGDEPPVRQIIPD